MHLIRTFFLTSQEVVGLCIICPINKVILSLVHLTGGSEFVTLSKCEDSAHAQLLRKLEAVFFPNLILSINVYLILIYLWGGLHLKIKTCL